VNNSNKCSKCQAFIQNPNDVICLNCGALLKSKKTVSDNSSVNKNSTKNTSSSFIQSFLSLVFLLITIFISYAYISDFQIFFKVTDYLFYTKNLTRSHMILQMYKKVALAKDLPIINFELNKLELEIKNTQNNHKKNKTLNTKYLNHTMGPKAHILNLQISLKNNTPFEYLVNQRFFYLKNANNIFHIKQENDFLLVFKPWETKTISLSFKQFTFNHTQKFHGELIFNNSVKYVKNKIIF